MRRVRLFASHHHKLFAVQHRGHPERWADPLDRLVFEPDGRPRPHRRVR